MESLPTAQDVLARVGLGHPSAEDRVDVDAVRVLLDPTSDRDAQRHALSTLTARIEHWYGVGNVVRARAMWWQADVTAASIGEMLDLDPAVDEQMIFASRERTYEIGYTLELAAAELRSGVLRGPDRSRVVRDIAEQISPQLAVEQGLALAALARRIGQPSVERSYLDAANDAVDRMPRSLTGSERRYARANVEFALARLDLEAGNPERALDHGLRAWRAGRGNPNPSREIGVATIIATAHDARGSAQRGNRWRGKAQRIEQLARIEGDRFVNQAATARVLLADARGALAEADHFRAIANFSAVERRVAELPDDDTRGRMRVDYMRALREAGFPDAAVEVQRRGTLEVVDARTAGDQAIERGLIERDRGSDAAAGHWFGVAREAYRDALHTIGMVHATSQLRSVGRGTRRNEAQRDNDLGR